MAFDWVVYGATPWAGTWYDEHNLAHALARDGRVLFVDPPLSPLTPLRAANTPASALWRRAPVRVGRVWRFRPLALAPLEHPRVRAASTPLVRRQIACAVRRLGLRRPVVLAARWTPGLEGAAGEVARVAVVDDWVPAGDALIGRSRGELLAEVDAVCAAADLTVVPSEALRRTLAGRGHAAEVLRHGFPADLRARYDRPEEPAFMRGLARPRLLYVGGLDDRIDFGGLQRLAETRPEASLVLLGPVSPRLASTGLESLRRCANVVHVDRRPREELPAAMMAASCLLLPYRPGEWAEHGAPLKLWEYLYAGAPLAGTGYSSLAEYPPPLVHHVEPPADIADAVAAALAEEPGGAARRREYALANTWDDRARSLTGLVERALAGARHPAV